MARTNDLRLWFSLKRLPFSDGHAAKDMFLRPSPNEKWLTDITEFSLQDGKVYLSPVIDCFDGMVVSWT